MSITAPACASCVLGATSSLLSFTYHQIETITVKVVPHITVYTQGSSTSSTTNYVSITETASDFVGGGSNRNASKTYSKLEDLTWMVGDATLTYPTTYVQYFGFAGAAVPTDDGEKCAKGADATALTLPSSTDAASFIYPWTSSGTGASPLPEPLLEYLQGQTAFAAQFSGQPLTGCAGTDYVPPKTSSNAPYSTESTSSITLSSVPALSSAPASKSNYTFSSTRQVGGPGGPTRITPGQPLPSAIGSSVAPTSTAAPGPYSSPATYATLTTENTHSTAFVIQPITARHPIVTTLPGGSDQHHTTKHHTTTDPEDGPHTNTHDDNQPSNYGHSPGGHNTATRGPAHDGHHTGGDHVTTADHNESPGKPHHVFTVGSSEITAKPHGPVTFGHHTLHHGQTIILGHGPSATTVALQGHGSHERLVVNGKTQKGQYTPATGSHAEVSSAIITSNGHKITAIYSGGSVVLKDGSSKTTIAAGSKVTFDGQTIKVPSHGSSVKINGHKVPLTAVPSSQAVITAGGHTLTAIDSDNSVILKDGSKTITVKDGARTKFEGHTISVGPSGSAIVVDGKTVTLSAAPTPQAIITAGGHIITALDISGSVILEDGHSTTTVKEGRKVVFEGQTIKIPSHGTAVVVNGRTVDFTTSTPATSKTTTGVGGYVNSGLGGGTPSPTVKPADTNAAASAGLAAFDVLWSALLAALGLLVVI